MMYILGPIATSTKVQQIVLIFLVFIFKYDILFSVNKVFIITLISNKCVFEIIVYDVFQLKIHQHNIFFNF
jgi:hypothetical protein